MLGLSFYIANLILMIVISSLVKELSTRYPLQQILLFRFALALLPFAVLMFLSKGPSLLKTQVPATHAIRSMSGVLSIGMFFYALSAIPMAEATILVYSSPIIVTVIAVPFLGEKIGWQRTTAVIVGFVGMMVIVQPASSTLGLGMMAGIGSAAFGAVVSVCLRKLGETEPIEHIAVAYNGTGTVVWITCCLLFGWVVPVAADLGMLVALGCVAMVQQYCLTTSFRFGEASMLAPFEYISLVLAAISGYMFWGEIPNFTTWAGAGIIVASGLFMIHREAALKRESKQPVTESETLPGV